MLTRIAFVLSAAFWVTMNYLLWRSEFAGTNHRGSPVPTELVWRKILTSPDNSSLDILHHGKKVGYARWAVSERYEPAGAPAGYQLDLEGNVALAGAAGRIHLDLSVLLAADRAWQELNLRASQREHALAVHTRAAEGFVRLSTENNGEMVERVLTFADLQNPRALADALAVPVPMELFGVPDLPADTPGGVLPGWELAWEARSDRINLGRTVARVYRLQTRLLDHWQIVILVSPVGEILRVELPDEWVLASDETGGY